MYNTSVLISSRQFGAGSGMAFANWAVEVPMITLADELFIAANASFFMFGRTAADKLLPSMESWQLSRLSYFRIVSCLARQRHYALVRLNVISYAESLLVMHELVQYTAAVRAQVNENARACPGS